MIDWMVDGLNKVLIKLLIGWLGSWMTMIDCMINRNIELISDWKIISWMTWLIERLTDGWLNDRSNDWLEDLLIHCLSGGLNDWLDV